MIGTLGSLRDLPADIKINKSFVLSPETASLFEKLSKDESRLHLIADCNRLGVSLFFITMEFTHFHPRRGNNKVFDICLFKWPDNAFVWNIVSFPIEYKSKAEEILENCGLRIANGIPHLFDSDGAQIFPLDGKTVFTLENYTNHPCYSNDINIIKELREKEKAECNKILDKDRKEHIGELKEQGFLLEQIERMLGQWDKGNDKYEEIPFKRVL